MDKEKEIEEMAEFIGETISVRHEGDRFPLTVLTRDFLAKRIINKGYRNADEVRKEMRGEIEKLKSALADAVRSFTRMETLYKLKCNALESAKDEIAGLTGKVEALQQDNESLRRTLEEGREAIKEAKKETAHEIFERVNKWIDEIVPHTKEWTILFCLLGWINTKYGVEDDE